MHTSMTVQPPANPAQQRRLTSQVKKAGVIFAFTSAPHLL